VDTAVTFRDSRPPGIPTALVAKALDPTHVEISMQLSGDGDVRFGIFEWATDSLFTSPGSYLASGISNGTVSYVFSATPATRYWVRGAAKDSSGNISSWTENQTVTTPLVLPTAPDPPSALSASGTSDTTILVVFTHGTRSLETQVELSTTSDFSSALTHVIAGTEGTGGTTTFIGLSPQTMYWIRARSHGASQYSAYGSVDTAVTFRDSRPPGIPTEFSVVIIQENRIQATCIAPPERVQGIVFELSEDTVFTSFVTQRVHILPSALASTVFINARVGVWYWVRAKAYGQNGEGLYTSLSSICISPPLGVDPSVSTPKDFSLSQNYPNPFNPSTTIGYTLPVQIFVTLKVYNMLGQEVATLVNGTQEQGNHSVPFDASGLSSGIYLYRLTTPSGTLSHKLLLTK
jgi:chitodextrinase